MFYNERQEQILDILERRKSVTVRALAEELYAGESTVRRDLTALEKAGKVRRTFGGAVLEESMNREVPLLYRQSRNHRQKQIIAAKARALADHGMVLFLDASTTAGHLIPVLADLHDLTVITNSPNTALEAGAAGIRTFCTGGLLLGASQAFVGSDAEAFVRRFNADLMFFSSRGVSEDGLVTDSSVEESQLRRVMMERADRTCFLYDTEKLGRRYAYNLCRLDQVDDVINELDS